MIPSEPYFPGTSDGSPQTSAQTVIPAPVTMVATSETRGTYRPPAVKFMMRSDFFPLLQANEVKNLSDTFKYFESFFSYQ